jgi:glycosyltransferase involved in cell wall biosynthesis
MEERAREAGLETLGGLQLRRGFRPAGLIADIRKIRECIRREGVDIIHAWHSIEYWTAATATLGTDCRIVRTRGLVTPIKPSLVNRFIHSRTGFVHVTCEAIEENYRRAGFDINRVKLVYDGVDISRFNPSTGDEGLRESLGIPSAAPVLVSVGRLEGVKGHKYLIPAIAQARKAVSDLHLIMAGDGSQREVLEAQIAERGLTDCVHLLGVRNDIPTVLAAGDLYILTSIGSEGSSRATQEAMAAGKAVIATEVGMLPDIVREGETGRIVPKEDSEALADAIANLLSNRQTCADMGKAARAWVELEFDEQIFVSRIVDLYKDLLERNS